MSTDVTTIVIPLRNSTPLGRLNYTEALGALNQINTLGFTIGGGGSSLLNPIVNDGSLFVSNEYEVGEFQNEWSRNLVDQIRNTYPLAARLNRTEWTSVIVAINTLAGNIVVPASGPVEP